MPSQGWYLIKRPPILGVIGGGKETAPEGIAEEAVEIALRRAGVRPGEAFHRPLRYPEMPEQGSRRQVVEEFLKAQRSS